MFDFGDEVTVESYRIPWLIWAQLLVMLLLILLLYCLTLISLDPSDSFSPCSSSSSPSSSRLVLNDDTQKEKKRFLVQNTVSTVLTNRSQNTQVGQSQIIKGEISEGTSTTVMRIEEIGSEQEEQFPVGPQIYFHPCFYVRLARRAFLKCLGLDSKSESSSTAQRSNKKKEE